MFKHDMRETSFFIRIVKDYELDYTDMNPLHYRNGSNLISISQKIKLSDLSNFAAVSPSKITVKETNEICNVIDLEDIDKTIGEVTRIKQMQTYEVSGQKTSFEFGDILFGKLRPYLNNVAIVDNVPKDMKLIGSSEWTKISPSKYPYYLLFALRSNYILSQTLTTKGSIRPRLKDDDIPKLKIPELNQETMSLINDVVSEIFKRKETSDYIIKFLIKLYDKICDVPSLNEEQILVVDGKNVDNQRMDSEYFLYRKINSEIMSNKNGVKLSDYVTFSEDKINSYYVEGDSINYITIADIDSNLGEIVAWREKTYSENADRELKAPNRAKMLLKHNDILVPHLKGSLSSVSWVPERMNNFIGTTGFSIIRSEKLEHPFLYVIMRSKLIQDQLLLLANGSIMEDLTNGMIGDVAFILPPKKFIEEINKIGKSALEERWKSREAYHLVWKAFHDYCSVNVNNEMLQDQLNRISEELTKRKLIAIPPELKAK